jgi:hypothetical protein
MMIRAATVTFPSAVNGQTSFQFLSRRLREFDQIDPTAQPACFGVQHRETYTNRGVGTPAVRVLDFGFWCFARTDDPSIEGDDLLDSMFEGIEAAFGTPDDVMKNELTLGGLAYYVKIDQRDNMLIRDPGDIDGQALLIVPFRIMLP